MRTPVLSVFLVLVVVVTFRSGGAGAADNNEPAAAAAAAAAVSSSPSSSSSSSSSSAGGVEGSYDGPVFWHIPVDCGFSGFFVEFLNLVRVLNASLPEARLFSVSDCPEGFIEQLFPEEREAFRSMYLPQTDTTYSAESRACSDRHNAIEAASAKPAAMPGLLANTDFVGVDLPRAMDGIRVSSLHVCDCLCEARSACVGWSFHADSPDVATGQCYLKAWIARVSSPPTKGSITSRYAVNRVAVSTANGTDVEPRQRDTKPRISIWLGKCDVDYIRQSQQVGFKIIARIMAESTRPQRHLIECASIADEVWLPNAFIRGVFERLGVEPWKMHIVHEAVDPAIFKREATDDVVVSNDTERFVFYSVFKWERRKGWDILLDAFWTAFDKDDNVVLVLHTFRPHWETGSADINVQIEDYAQKTRGKGRADLAAVEWAGSSDGEELSRSDLRDALKLADAFVLPSRGEGWGLPAHEAMTMGIPTAITNWSGPTEFTSCAPPRNSSDCPVAYLIPVESSLDSLGFARPRGEDLVTILREMHTESTDGSGTAQRIGAAGRRHMATHFSPEVVAAQALRRVNAVASGRIGKEFAGHPKAAAAKKKPRPVSSRPRVFVSLTTMPDRLAHPWFEGALRNILRLQGNFTVTLNLPANRRTSRTSQFYEIPATIAALAERPEMESRLEIYDVAMGDQGPLTKLLGALENDDIADKDLIFVCDDDIHYRPKAVELLVDAHSNGASSHIYASCSAHIAGYQGYLATKGLFKRLLGVLMSDDTLDTTPKDAAFTADSFFVPPSCMRIDDDFLELALEYLGIPVVGVPYETTSSGDADQDSSWTCSFDQAKTDTHPDWSELANDKAGTSVVVESAATGSTAELTLRERAQAACRRDFYFYL